eukprot:11406798-Alexandrium_andersonii.AAC.1
MADRRDPRRINRAPGLGLPRDVHGGGRRRVLCGVAGAGIDVHHGLLAPLAPQVSEGREDRQIVCRALGLELCLGSPGGVLLLTIQQSEDITERQVGVIGVAQQ